MTEYVRPATAASLLYEDGRQSPPRPSLGRQYQFRPLSAVSRPDSATSRASSWEDCGRVTSQSPSTVHELEVGSDDEYVDGSDVSSPLAPFTPVAGSTVSTVKRQHVGTSPARDAVIDQMVAQAKALTGSPHPYNNPASPARIRSPLSRSTGAGPSVATSPGSPSECRGVYSRRSLFPPAPPPLTQHHCQDRDTGP